jgi:DNA-binding Lrp family transcriptional regulator
MMCIITESCSKEVADNLRLISGVKKVYLTVGNYDVVTMIQGESLSQLREKVIPTIQGAHNIKSTLTLAPADASF